MYILQLSMLIDIYKCIELRHNTEENQLKLPFVHQRDFDNCSADLDLINWFTLLRSSYLFVNKKYNA